MFYHQSTAAVADDLYQPTPRQYRRASPLPEGLSVYLVFQPMRLAIVAVTGARRGLLPRVFTLAFCKVADLAMAPLQKAVYSLWRSLWLLGYPHSLFPLGSMVARAARTFLSAFLPSDRTVPAIFQSAKVRLFFHMEKKSSNAPPSQCPLHGAEHLRCRGMWPPRHRRPAAAQRRSLWRPTWH